MSRRSSLPGADELFRTTGPERVAAAPGEPAGSPGADAPAGTSPAADADTGLTAVEAALAGLPSASGEVARSLSTGAGPADELAELRAPSSTVRHTGVRRRPRAVGDRRPSGRERHDEKITVYVSAEELMDLEQARLALRGDHGLVADRGRIVREALAVVLADLEAKGDQSILVRRLTGR